MMKTQPANGTMGEINGRCHKHKLWPDKETKPSTGHLQQVVRGWEQEPNRELLIVIARNAGLNNRGNGRGVGECRDPGQTCGKKDVNNNLVQPCFSAI